MEVIEGRGGDKRFRDYLKEAPDREAPQTDNKKELEEFQAAKPLKESQKERFQKFQQKAKTQLEKYRNRAALYEQARQQQAKNYRQSVKGWRARFGYHGRPGRPYRGWQRSARNRPQREIADARRFVGNPQNEYDEGDGGDNFGILHDFMSARRGPEDEHAGLGVPNLLQDWSFVGRGRENEREEGKERERDSGFGFGIRTDLIGGGSSRKRRDDLWL